MTDTSRSLSSLLSDLDALLDRERIALMDGALDDIGPIMDKKTELIDALSACAPDDSKTLQPIQMKLRRNQELFDHALAGIRNVAERLGALRRIRTSMDVYNSSGQRATICEPEEKSMERRA